MQSMPIYDRLPTNSFGQEFANFAHFFSIHHLFAAQLLSADESAKFIVDQLKKQGLYEDTVIIFLSDVWHL